MRLARGVSRTCLLVGPLAIKVPARCHFVRGWLGNRSEFLQARGQRQHVLRPYFSVLHLALVSRRADAVGPAPALPAGVDIDGDEGKPTSWGRFGEEWLLIDFDRAYDSPRGLVGALYWGNQERLARKWMKLPQGDDMGETTDRNDPGLGHGPDDAPTGQNPSYLVLSPEERAKGFVRPVRTSYRHQKCGAVTTMSVGIAETYARDPKFYGSTYCTTCRMHRPVGWDGEFEWLDGTKVGT